MIYSIDKRIEKFEGLEEMKLPERFNEQLIGDFSNKGPGKLIFLIPEEHLYETFVLSKFPKYILREYAMIKLDDDNKLYTKEHETRFEKAVDLIVNKYLDLAKIELDLLDKELNGQSF